MGRQFEMTHRGRSLAVRVRPIDDAWELWLYENGRELALADVLSIDDATVARRNGSADPVADAVSRIRVRLDSGEIRLPS
ncbi:MAG: hypothetical protein JSR91_04580 [Proteobacteria bacterium]|nr:hypothetical protein [Pseudomonadota bacterium]